MGPFYRDSMVIIAQEIYLDFKIYTSDFVL
jgi:hypothetical protein